MKKSVLSFGLLFCSIVSFSQTATWNILTSGTTSTLYAVSAINKDTCYVGGAAGKVMKTTNGGITWTTQTTPTSSFLYGMDFINGNKGFAVGDNGTIIKTTNGGASWTNVVVTSNSLRSIRFLNSTTGFITGENGLILKTIDGGTSWNTTNTGSLLDIYAVWFTSSTTGFASCFNGTLLKTTDGGTTWTGPSSTGVSTQINTINFTSPMIGTFVGANGVIRRTVDGGATWNTVSMTASSDFHHGHTFVDANTGFITGGNTGTNVGVILTTVDGGITWTSSHPGTAKLANLDFPNANVGYAVGVNGTILKYTSNVGIQENITKPALLCAYPNPTNSYTNVDISTLNINETTYLELFDISGKLVKKQEFTNGAKLIIENEELNAGIYFFNVSTKEKLIGIGKIIIE